MSEFSFFNGDNFIRNMVTVMGAGCAKHSVPPVGKKDIESMTWRLPVSLEAIGNDLRVDDLDEESETLTRIALGAAAFMEVRTAYVISPGTYQVDLPAFWSQTMYVNRGPLRKINSIKAMTGRDVWVDIDPEDYWAMADSTRSFGLRYMSSFTRPTLWSEVPMVRVEFDAGFLADGENDSDADLKKIDDGLLTTFLALTAHMYQHRELFEADKAAEVEAGMGSLLQAYRKYW